MVVDYYQTVAPLMLRYLVDRPLTLERYPAGIDKPGFMQKNAGKGFPAFIRRIELPKQDGAVSYPVIDDLEGLLYLANQNTITFHIPCFRSSHLDHPDRLVFDLDPSPGDPDGARFGARVVAEILKEWDLPSWVMTTGSKGFHVVVPLAPTIDFETLARFAQATAHLLAHRYPQQLTIEFLKKERRDRVFVDWLRNGFGPTGVSPYSLRPRAGAPIAMPMSWDELDIVVPDQFHLTDAADRLTSDPWRDAEPQDLSGAVKAIEATLEREGIELAPFDRFGH